MQMKKLLLGGGAVLAIGIFLAVIYAVTNTPAKTTYHPELSKITASDHISWSPDNKQILVEYSDFQCPACKIAHEYLKSFATTKEGQQVLKKVTFVYRYYPLTQIHQNALASAYAAEAAGKQQKFNEMADVLFTKQGEWGTISDAPAKFVEYAKSLGLNTDQFQKDMTSQETVARIAADIKSGDSVGIEATPTFYLNGKKLELNSPDDLKQSLLEVSK
ncbi:thioredoxin domain-containing protein [Candidatus Roizmanbacteria bacterium]|nr:thioredoxin domain-containing protein [Candidatus Roizmanbacteria bacterium]